MSKKSEKIVDTNVLNYVLSKMLNKSITRAAYELNTLQGGTIGQVQLVKGIAETSAGETHPYQIVWKIQRKFERHGDPNSWRREYDLNEFGFNTIFTRNFRCPECYHAELHDDEIHLWLEYIDGVSGSDLTLEMFKDIAEQLGEFQGKLYSQNLDLLKNVPNVSEVNFLRKDYVRYRSWPVLSNYVRDEECELPSHLCKMLIDFDNQSDHLFNRLEKLPIVFCHRDFWVENILYNDGKISIIDWDTAGWGYMGEDIASLIGDETDISLMIEYVQTCVPLYYKGFSKYTNVPSIHDHCIGELMIAKFGYRMVEGYKFAQSPEDKQMYLNTLQKMYEIQVL